jgi:hypothetical protein
MPSRARPSPQITPSPTEAAPRVAQSWRDATADIERWCLQLGRTHGTRLLTIATSQPAWLIEQLHQLLLRHNATPFVLYGSVRQRTHTATTPLQEWPLPDRRRPVVIAHSPHGVAVRQWWAGPALSGRLIPGEGLPMPGVPTILLQSDTITADLVLEATPEEWLPWGRRQGIHPLLCAGLLHGGLFANLPAPAPSFQQWLEAGMLLQAVVPFDDPYRRSLHDQPLLFQRLPQACPDIPAIVWTRWKSVLEPLFARRRACIGSQLTGSLTVHEEAHAPADATGQSLLVVFFFV